MGVFFALLVIFTWASHLVYMFMFVDFAADNPFMYLHILIQGYLYTGLFITGHDAMHRSLSRHKTVNNTLGTLAVFLFAGMSYKKLLKNHGLHHKAPATKDDPDFYVKSQNFFVWWAVFMWRYVTIGQLLIMAATYNILIHIIELPELQTIIYWALPAILGTIQLFYFGVFWPHRLPHKESMMPHRARTLKQNNLWAMVSCYFFGYHWEHHEKQHLPWWKLHTTKSNE